MRSVQWPAFRIERKQRGSGDLIRERKLAIPYPTIFLSQLSEKTKDIIREDLRPSAEENGCCLAWAWEADVYAGLSRRFCDIDDIYRGTQLTFCREREDAEAYFNEYGEKPLREQTR